MLSTAASAMVAFSERHTVRQSIAHIIFEVWHAKILVVCTCMNQEKRQTASPKRTLPRSNTASKITRQTTDKFMADQMLPHILSRSRYLAIQDQRSAHNSLATLLTTTMAKAARYLVQLHGLPSHQVDQPHRYKVHHLEILRNCKKEIIRRRR